MMPAFKFFMLAAAAHLAVCRLTPSGKFMRNGLLVGFLALLSGCVREFRSGRADLAALYTLVTAWLAYLAFFINILNSVTLKMLARLAEEPGGSLPAKDFESVFSVGSGLAARLKDMEKNGFVKAESGRLALTAVARKFLAMVLWARKVLSVDFAG